MKVGIIVAACLVGITLAGTGGGLIPMTEEEIEKCVALMNGVDIAVEKLNLKNDRKENEYRLVATDITQASKQVISGMKYYVHVKMQESTCKNNESNKNKDIVDCPIKNGGDNKDCVFTIWSRPWMKKFGKDIIVTNIKC